METEAKRPRVGVVRAMLRLAAGASTVLLALALVGYVVRDRTWWLALLMYLPMVLVAPVVIVTQAIAFERARWRRRASVIAAAAVTTATLLSPEPADGVCEVARERSSTRAAST